MSGSNFVHGIVVVGGLYALLNASTGLDQAIGFFAVLLGSGNAAGGYAVPIGCSPCSRLRNRTPSLIMAVAKSII